MNPRKSFPSVFFLDNSRQPVYFCILYGPSLKTFCTQHILTILRATFLIIRHQKKLDLILSTVKVLVMSIIFTKETMGQSLTSSARDSSQKFTPDFIKNLKMLIKIVVVERLI